MQSNLNSQKELGISGQSASKSFMAPMQPTGVGAAGLSLIRQFEGCSLTPYLCPVGYWTIGYGHRIKENEINGMISQQQAETWLRQDAENARIAVIRLTPILFHSSQADALTSFVFNLGAAAYQRSRLRQAVLREEADSIRTELMRWVWGGGKKLPGLVKRRAAEWKLFSQDIGTVSK